MKAVVFDIGENGPPPALRIGSLDPPAGALGG
jgi:hypothetical protein